jgi:hypothetical protein
MKTHFQLTGLQEGDVGTVNNAASTDGASSVADATSAVGDTVGDVSSAVASDAAGAVETPAADLGNAAGQNNQGGVDTPVIISTGIGIVLVSLPDTRGPTTTLPRTNVDAAPTPPPAAAAPVVSDPAANIGAGSSGTYLFFFPKILLFVQISFC